jgi:hypothetical protein
MTSSHRADTHNPGGDMQPDPVRTFPATATRVEQADRPDDRDNELMSWAIVVPVLQQHYSLTAPGGRAIEACACSPSTPRSTHQWARHVSDEIASRIE